MKEKQPDFHIVFEATMKDDVPYNGANQMDIAHNELENVYGTLACEGKRAPMGL